MKTKTTKYYHENSDVIAFERVEKSNGYSYECTYDEKGNLLTYKTSDGFSYEYTYDEKGNELTYKNSGGYFRIKEKIVTQEEYDNFINTLNRPCVGKKVVVDGVEYELK